MSQPQSSAGSRLPRSNSVESSTAGISESDESESYEDRVARRASECVEQFRERYPERSGLPVSKTPGRELRAELVEEFYEEEYVEPVEEWRDGHTVERLDRAEPVTWAELLYEFLTARQSYDDGLGGRFETREGDTFTVDFNDCWTPEYGQKQAARNAAAVRQLAGGRYPEGDGGDDLARAGETTGGEWGNADVATVMLTRTGSARPEGELIPCVDHADGVTRTWSDGGVYHTVRNAAEYHLELDTDEWFYVRGDDVHGLDGDGGTNSAYAHCHDAIYVNLDATGLRDEFDTDEEIRRVLESTFYAAIEKHVEECPYAKPEAHTREKSIDVRLDLENPGAYATEYLRLSDDEEMMEKPVEFQAFAAMEWATNRQRIARSNLANDAARADRCLQDPETEHGGKLVHDGNGDVVCAHCGSSVGIDDNRAALFEMFHSEPSEFDESGSVSEEVIGARIGETPREASVRSDVRRYVEEHGTDEPVSVVAGSVGVSPQHRHVVEEELAGECSAAEVEEVRGEGGGPDPWCEMTEMVLPDGGTEPVSGGGGGVQKRALVLPVERLLQETRLKHWGGVGRPKIVCRDGDDVFASYDPLMAACWLKRHGYRQPWHAELAIEFTNHGDGIPAAFDEPVAKPPPGVGGVDA